ncbi:MAG: YjjG family noncanonical pyrimidine nucleotidase [Bacteroidota bacterium]
MKQYKYILFDLDHTLWDYDRNANEVLFDLYDKYELGGDGGYSADEFTKVFHKVNRHLWSLHDVGKIGREDIREGRFKRVLEQFDDRKVQLSGQLSDDYMYLCPRKTHTIPYAIEVLDYLHGKYRMYIVTNGFEDVQHIKISGANLTHYFGEVITSEKAGYKKPSKEIFDHTLALDGAKPYEAIMIGDNLDTDILGARNADIDTVYFNPDNSAHEQDVTHEIDCLSRLMNIL